MISLKKTLSAISSKFSAISSKFTALNTLLNDVPHYTLLWTNPNPTSSFSAQTISLDLSKYDAVEIVSWKTAGEPIFLSSRIPYMQAKKGGIIYIDPSHDKYCRQYTTYASSIAFEGGYIGFSAPRLDNSRCVPYKIYGIKFGGGV